MAPQFINPEMVEDRLNWLHLASALEQGHSLPKAQISTGAIRRGDDTILSLTAWIEGLGIAAKAPTVFPGNAAIGTNTVNGGFCLFSDKTGVLEAVIDFHLITKWKTAADSLLASMKLAHQRSDSILIVGAGVVADSMVEAYRAGFPSAQITIWNRTNDNAVKLARGNPDVLIADELEPAVRAADIICCATMSSDPLLRGNWLRAGQHVDLIGSYRPDMREADDEALRRARIFVDNKEMALKNSGDLFIPLSSGVISADDIIADFYDLPEGRFQRQSEDEITLFKNGGGAHLDLMAARYILDVCEDSRSTERTNL